MGEIADAQWFPVSRLPALPHRLSVARRLIDHAVAQGEPDTTLGLAGPGLQSRVPADPRLPLSGPLGEGGYDRLDDRFPRGASSSSHA